MQAAATTGASARLGHDVIPARRHSGDALGDGAIGCRGGRGAFAPRDPALRMLSG
jgi:hypothetical protein